MSIHKFGLVRETQIRDRRRDKHRDEVTYRQHRNIETDTEMYWLKHRDEVTYRQHRNIETDTEMDWLRDKDSDRLTYKNRDGLTSWQTQRLRDLQTTQKYRDKHRDGPAYKQTQRQSDRQTPTHTDLETNAETDWLRDKHRDRLT